MKLDRRRKYYLVLDCETATLPFANKYEGKAKQNVAIAKPLIYDLAWQIIDRKGRVYDKQSYLITEIFSVPSVFNTAYYKEKRPLYLEKLRNREIELVDWNTAITRLQEALEVVECVGAYNSMFDFKKAIPFTESYIENLYSDNYSAWEEKQKRVCDNIAIGKKFENSSFDSEVFSLRGIDYPMFDIWGLACKHLLNCEEYKDLCIENKWYTASKKYFKTSAETTFRFYSRNTEFIESHTALEDTIIESQIFANIVKSSLKNLTIGLIYFPFRILGTVEEYEIKKGVSLC